MTVIMEYQNIDPELCYEQLKSAISEGLPAGTDACVVAIAEGGTALANLLAEELFPGSPIGVINASFHRDDISLNPIPKTSASTGIPFDVEGRTILLVDDVFASGRTLRAALNELFDHGRPAQVFSAALIDTCQRRLPLVLDFAGTRIAVPENIKVRVRDNAGKRPFTLQMEKR
jgi:pyrimidine operon attenuation protein/uracil phosphoribosyltransferase